MNTDEILKQMTAEEKIALCSGKNFWETKSYEKYGIPSLFMCDGPHGLRKQERENGSDMLGINKSRPSTCFPAEVTMAASRDPGLTEEIGRAVGEEAENQGVGLVLGPGVNIKRNPLCGRNFEYYGEDPYLSGKLAAGFIRGIESHGIGTSLKHFAANSRENGRFNSDSIMDERTLRELYLSAFEIAVKEGKPSTVMCAYPKLNGVHCSDNGMLLTDILRTEWGFDGAVITDWGAMNDRIKGFEAGCDLSMPGGSDYMEKDVLRALREGILDESTVDRCARRVLNLVFASDEAPKKTERDCDYDAHHDLARRAAEQGAVLLKNDDRILPLKDGANIAVIGAMAKNMRFQGAGSSHINPIKISQPLDFLPKNAAYALGCDDRGDTTDKLILDAAEKAKNADVAIVFAGLPDRYESEGFDRSDMKMPEGHIKMIEAVARANPDTVVVLMCGCVVECPWADSVKGILYMGLPGQAGGEAIANLLYGRANPCGRLAESWPFVYEDVPSSEIYDRGKDELYSEGIYVGYRYYDKSGVPTRWPFGYGLCYTDFTYSDLKANDGTVTVNVKNTGNCPGAEVVELYVCPPQDGLHRPIRELKGFEKVFLNPGEEKNVSFELDERSFAVWNEGWKIAEGDYTVRVGELSAVISIRGEKLTIPAWQNGSWYENCKGKPSVAQWEAATGIRYRPQILERGRFTMDNTLLEMKDHSLIMKIMFKAVEATIAKGFGGKKDYDNPEFRMLINSSAGSSLRAMQISGGMKGGLLSGMLEIANGHFFRGIRKMITG